MGNSVLTCRVARISYYYNNKDGLKMKKIGFILLFFLGCFGSFFVFADTDFVFADTEGEIRDFFVDKNYDLLSREKISAFLQKVSQNGYFYLEKNWFNNLKPEEKEKIIQNLEILSQEFDQIIYPQLTSLFGSEWKPGIDNDERITILFHQLKEEGGGYFNSGDEFPKLQNPHSNEREMIYLATKSLFFDKAKNFLAHEFVHLITFNQKERLHGASEETWLNEARAEYAPSYLNYNEIYQNSILQQRVNIFLENSSDSLIGWDHQKKDYGSVNLFTQYLVDHYQKEILVDSLNSEKIGLSSLNYALEKNKINKKIFDIFLDWVITNFLNNCSFGQNYCYKNPHLQNFRIIPSLIFLPSPQQTNIQLKYSIKPWSSHWYRIVGGEGDLEIEFKGVKNDIYGLFKVAFVLCQDTQLCQVDYFKLDKEQKGKVVIKDFGKNYTSLTLIPVVFNKEEKFFDFSLFISIENLEEKEKLMAELLVQIEELRAKIRELQVKIRKILREKISCQRLTQNLYYGLRSKEIQCLQEFLKFQGKKIYPEGLTTGFFGPLTFQAVIRFQEKYSSEILIPQKLNRGTGYVDFLTRSKINEILNPKEKIGN